MTTLYFLYVSLLEYCVLFFYQNCFIFIYYMYFLELLDLYCNKFHSPGILSRDVIASIIDSIIVHSSVQYDPNNHKLYCFFHKNLETVIRR